MKRGLNVLDALLKDLLKKGMSYASDIILTGCSGEEYEMGALECAEVTSIMTKLHSWRTGYLPSRRCCEELPSNNC